MNCHAFARLKEAEWQCRESLICGINAGGSGDYPKIAFADIIINILI
jgi:hypothetical protein